MENENLTPADGVVKAIHVSSECVNQTTTLNDLGGDGLWKSFNELIETVGSITAIKISLCYYCLHCFLYLGIKQRGMSHYLYGSGTFRILLKLTIRVMDTPYWTWWTLVLYQEQTCLSTDDFH